MTRFDREAVGKIAQLSRLAFDDAQAERLAGQLSDVLGYIDKLNELDTADVEPSMHPLNLANILRDDVPRPSLSAIEALANAPETRDQCFMVPPIIQES